MKRKKPSNTHKGADKQEPASVRLNKYIASTGMCSRREADTLIAEGKVRVNGKVVTELGTKINPRDIVKVGHKEIRPEKHVYIILNKPKGYITTTKDPLGRATVMELIEGATEERVVPVGRLDRNTSGLLLFTNDGELAQAVAHPSKGIKKIYSLTLNKPFKQEDFDKMLEEGVTLEEGVARVTDMAYMDEKDAAKIGVEISIGWNRVVRRMFEALGYEVEKLDRSMLANLTKKNLSRGKWRHLTEKEIRVLRNLAGLHKTSA